MNEFAMNEWMNVNNDKIYKVRVKVKVKVDINFNVWMTQLSYLIKEFNPNVNLHQLWSQCFDCFN